MPAAAYTLEWTFTPVDYFDREFEIEGLDYRAWFALGKVSATVDQEVYDHFNPDVRADLEKAVRTASTARSLSQGVRIGWMALRAS